MAKVRTADNLNQGLPENTGLNDTIKTKMRLQLEGGNEGIVVGSFADLQRGTTGDPSSAPLNPNVPDDADLVTPAVADAQAGVQTVETDREGVEVAGSAEYDSMTKDELQAELNNQGIDYSSSETKAELRAKLG